MEVCNLVITSVIIGVVCSAPLGIHEGYSVDFGYEPSVHDVIVSDQFGYEPRIPEGYYSNFGHYPNFHESPQILRMPVTVLHSKGLFSGMTQFIGSMFPIEINVPDLFVAMWQSIPRPFANRRPFATTQTPRI